MATLQLPIRIEPASYIMTVELEGLFYDFSFRFNKRDNHWFMTIDNKSIRILSGIKVVHTEDMLLQFGYFQIDGRLPPGVFLIRDLKGSDRDPGRSNFGDEIIMLYTEATA